MHYSKQANVSRVGVQMAGLEFEKYGYIFREQAISDCGIDAQIEWVREHQIASGQLIALQIKSGESWFREENETGYVFRGDIRHLNYWLNHSLPVLIILCHVQSGNVYWQSISAKTVEYTAKGWKVTVPFEQQINAEKQTVLRQWIHQLESLPEAASQPESETPNLATVHRHAQKNASPNAQQETHHQRNLRSGPIAVMQRWAFHVYSFSCLLFLLSLCFDRQGKVSFSSLLEQTATDQGKVLCALTSLWCLWFIGRVFRHRSPRDVLVRRYLATWRKYRCLTPRRLIALSYLAKTFGFYVYSVVILLLLFSASLDPHRNLSLPHLLNLVTQPRSIPVYLLLIVVWALLLLYGYLPARKYAYSPRLLEWMTLAKGAGFYAYTGYCSMLVLGASFDRHDQVSLFHLMDEFFISDGGVILFLYSMVWVIWRVCRSLFSTRYDYSPRVAYWVARMKRGGFYLYSGCCIGYWLNLWIVALWIESDGFSASSFMDALFDADGGVILGTQSVIWMMLLISWYRPGRKHDNPAMHPSVEASVD